MDVFEYKNMRNLEDTHWWYVSTHRAVLRELVILAPHSKILDAGCGSGGLLDLSAERFQLTGFDASLIALRAASEKKSISQQLAQGVIEAIPVKNEWFDAVTCIDVIYHLKVMSEQTALSEMWRILKPGGHLILQVPAFECLRGGHDEVVHTRRRYRVKEIRSLLNETGFNVMKIFYRYPWLFLPALLIRKLSRGSGTSDLRPVHGAINTFLLRLSRFFDCPAFALLPFGSSVFAVAEKAS